MNEPEQRARPRLSVWVVLAALIGMALVAGGLYRFAVRGADGDPRPRGVLEDLLALRERSDLNVLFILVDTLRADRMGAYGYERDTSPNLDALAASGIRFAQQISQSSWTKCSMASLWTGLYPIRTRVLRAYDVLGGLPNGGHLAQRLDRPELRLLPGLRDLPQPAFPTARRGPDAAPREPQLLARGRRRRHPQLRVRVPARPRSRALVPLPPHDGRPPVRLLRGHGAVRHELLGRLRQLSSTS
jgi:hypothetical protein